MRELSMSPAPREAMKVLKVMTDAEESPAPTRKAPRRVAKGDAYPMSEEHGKEKRERGCIC